MSRSVARRIVGFELSLGSVAVFTFGMLTLSMGVPSNGVAVGTAVALLSAVLVAGADRSRLGVWILSVVGVLAIIALLLAGTEPWVIAVLPVGTLGLGVGSLLNRVLFGVVWSVPKARVERGFV